MIPRRVAMLPAEAEHPRAEKQRKYRQTHRRGRGLDMEIEVISWDGEGFDEGEWHRYALLACAWGTPEGPIVAGPEIRDRRGLTTVQLLDLIWSVASAHPQALNVMYGGSYDWDHWIKDITFETGRAVKTGAPVIIGPYTIKNNGIWFELGKGHAGGHRRITVWDMWKFWGTGFEPALRATFPDFHGLPVIKKFKELRGRFDWDMMDEVAHYNRLELEGLILLTRRFYDDLVEAGIPAPSYLTGAGALAGALDKKYHVPQHVGDQHFSTPVIEDAILRGFSAGRIEAWQIGYVKPRADKRTRVWQHDLVSAYPTAMRDLPSMAEGEWIWHEGNDVPFEYDKRMSIWFVRWDHLSRPGPTDRYYPFFYRTRTGNILYPPCGVGWQWWPEVVTARELGWTFQVLGGWVWRPADRLVDIRPYSWVPSVFKKRAQLKAEGKEGAQRVLKYGLNALYGKMCQSRGALYEAPPINQNLAWAGWVTSYCRAQIMSVANQAPESVLYLMTDSVVATKRLDVKIGKSLGDWEVEERTGALVAQAGVGSTWCRQCKDHPEGGEHAKYRGFDAESVTAQAILDMWKFNQFAGWPHPVSCVTRRPVTLAEAVMSEERWIEFGNWEDTNRDLNIYGGEGKRYPVEWDKMEPWKGLCPLASMPAFMHTETGEHLTLADIEAWCVKNDIDPISARYEPAWSELDPWSLPEVMGRMREVSHQTEHS